MLKQFQAEALDCIYESVTDPDALTRFMTAMICRFGGTAGDVVTEHPALRRIETHASFGFDPAFRASYDEDYLGRNRWVDGLARMPAGGCHVVETVTPAFRETPYYRDWALPQGLAQSLGALVE
ncbi:hypothetical protein [Thetidibacter halocola]|uniref:Uncharacterized protein n=1 Tax=Thetidibacter halocola TaxID=2827239 RepID=A0A8J7W8Z9_9RHOB|nr:hypothetical protein [Thetidibacter halocola]MBS0123095.1 hypothetical protein [Thetidibacter halocola]